MVEIGRELWKSSGPTTLLKQDNLDPVTWLIALVS